MTIELPTEAARVGRPYLPVAVAALVFLVMASVVSPIPRDEQSIAAPIEVPLDVIGDPNPAGATPEGSEGPGTDDGTNDPGSQGQHAGPATSSPGQSSDGAGGVQRCTDREPQVPGDPYSPPCLTFQGDNGGATHRGVTADEIVVSIRTLEGPSAAEIFSDLSGESVASSEESVEDTLLALGEYFSSRYQFYGRSLRFEVFRGEGSGASELLGGGKEKALSDAVRASETGAFADLTGITIPYADALTRQGIVNFGAPYPSRKWFEERAPYAWSLFPDGTVVTEAAVADIVARLRGQETAEYAGPSLRGQQRVYGIVAPENAEYQESVNRYIQLVEEAGIDIAINNKYKLDISSMPNQASNIVAQLKDAGVTTVICACDPVMLALGMTPKANEQGYEPEWLTGGLAFVEQDIVSQLIDSEQWSRAFGLAFNAESEPLGASFPYRAYKSVRPGDEPAFGVEEIYYQMLILAIGIQMAGPDLTPETYQAGMFSYPGGQGPRGHWSFGPGDFTPTDDFREIWWDPNKISPQNNKPGAWVQLGGGARYFPTDVPAGRAPYFE